MISEPEELVSFEAATTQAPQPPSWQDRFVPVRRAFVLSHSLRVMRGSGFSTVTGVPLRVKDTLEMVAGGAAAATVGALGAHEDDDDDEQHEDDGAAGARGASTATKRTVSPHCLHWPSNLPPEGSGAFGFSLGGRGEGEEAGEKR